MSSLPHRVIRVQPASADGIRPYGWLLGNAILDGAAPAFRSREIDFWQEHVFDPGIGGESEVLWVKYRNAELAVCSLEAHWLTEQALVPLTGPVIQVVAVSGEDGLPDANTLAAFRLSPGEGISMRPGCWHTTRVTEEGTEATCLMLTRRSTTADLARHLTAGSSLVESTVASINRVMLLLPE